MATAPDRTDLWHFELEGHAGLGSLTGYTVRAVDGRLGRVLRTVDDVSTGLLVVNTGPWFFGRLPAVPAGLIAGVDDACNTVQLHCGKQRLRRAPEYSADSAEAFAGYREKTGRYFDDAPGSDRHPG
ncbi:hypothetical protein [Streptacidiphilus jiangxiensis]|uniref:PRC-barrel domain-containing protein n=1 Tax=Streptacidiphilus jiangxiensis TaxID=235985 RepID=A0A1H7NV93_STRJI|nr:hypothetical protein [Streptacidiphilus jiangxiensis]SEL27453.1 hypothetical protein SAMN05414137_10791 [Streptacidiphilus jiangxiensis]